MAQIFWTHLERIGYVFKNHRVMKNEGSRSGWVLVRAVSLPHLLPAGEELGKPISQLFPLQCCFMIYVLWFWDSFLEQCGPSLHILSHEITEYLVHSLVTRFMHKVLSFGNRGISKQGHTPKIRNWMLLF